MERKPIVKTKRRPPDCSAVDSVNSDDINKTNYEDLLPTHSESVADLLEFYASIPDYGEVHHLSDTEFNQRLQTLREKRKHYISQDMQTPVCKINNNSTDQKNYIRKPTSFKRKSNLGLAVKKCEIHTKRTDPFGDADENKISRNRNMLFDDIEFRTDRFIPTPETFSVLSSDAGQPRDKVGGAKHVSKSIKTKSQTLGNNPELFRVESCSSVAASEKLPAEYCSKFECLSDSDSAPPLSYPLFRGSKVIKRKMNRPKTAIPTTLPKSSRATKLWTSDLSESKFDNKSACSERQDGKSVLCQSTPDLRPSPSTFKARPVPKNLFSSRSNYKMQNAEVYRSLQRKVRAEKLLHSSSLPPSMAAREKCSRSTSSNFQGGCGSRLTESECSSAKEGKCGNNTVVKQNCKGGHCNNKDSTPIGCPSTSGITSASSNESFPAVFRMRMQSCPPSVVIPSKNNLAAILRIQSTRQKMERDLEDKLAELKRKEDACIKAHLARQQPAWQAIQYSTEEDLALRRILRKEKEKRHLREHQLQMNLMLARVQQIPPLFERQTARRSIGQCRK